MIYSFLHQVKACSALPAIQYKTRQQYALSLMYLENNTWRRWRKTKPLQWQYVTSTLFLCEYSWNFWLFSSSFLPAYFLSFMWSNFDLLFFKVETNSLHTYNWLHPSTWLFIWEYIGVSSAKLNANRNCVFVVPSRSVWFACQLPIKLSVWWTTIHEELERFQIGKSDFVCRIFRFEQFKSTQEFRSL